MDDLGSRKAMMYLGKRATVMAWVLGICYLLTRERLDPGIAKMSSSVGWIVGAFISALPLFAVAQDMPSGSFAQGEYLATAAGCVSCHTAEGGAPFAGGLDISTPFGVLRSANITPDRETGIGTWSKADFQRALREGVRKDGAPLYPAMPYNHYTRIEDADINALWAYFKSVGPVRNEVEVDDLMFPYNIRAGMKAWQALFFDPGRFKPDPGQDAEFNRGAYLVEALGHCSACHSPHDALGVEVKSRYLNGGSVPPWYAPDISNSPESVLSGYSVEGLAAYLSGDDAGHNRRAVGPMAEVVINSLSKLTREDVHAIAVYLKTRPATPGDAPSAPITLTEESRAAGEGVYASNCVTCHGSEGAGADGIAARLAGSGSVADGPPYNAVAVLLEGVAPRGDWGVMPSFANVLTDSQIADVVNYIRTNWQNAASSAATPDYVAYARGLVGGPAAHVAQATVCPAVPADHIDDTARDSIAALGTAMPTTETVAPIVAGYSQRLPALTRSERITALTGAYCNGIAALFPDREAVITRELTFMDLVGDLVAN